MTFAPGHAHDVFISYAHSDNQSILHEEGKSYKWISKLLEHLKPFLRVVLRSPTISIWMDERDIRGNEPLDEQLIRTVQSSATLVVILSKGYTLSNYCLNELKAFCTHFADPTRIFVIEYDIIPPDDKPSEIRDLVGYRFCSEDSPGFPVPVESNLSINSLRKLSSQLGEKLHEIKNQNIISATGNPLPDADVEQSTQDDQTPISVYVASGTRLYNPDYQSIRTYLEQSGYRVVGEDLSRQSDPEKLTEDLAAVEYFIQFLAPHNIASKEGQSVRELERMQLQKANELHKTLLRGCSKETYQKWKSKSEESRSARESTEDISREADEQHKNDEELFRNIQSMDIEEFRIMIVKELQALSNNRKRQSDPNNVSNRGSDNAIAIYTKTGDKEIAQNIGNHIELRDIDFCIYTFEERDDALANYVKRNGPSGLIVIHGTAAKPECVREAAYRIREIAIGCKAKRPITAIYYKPEENKNLKLFNTQKIFSFDILDNGCPDFTFMNEFLSSIQSREA